ncbi:trace amine-associated receptor 1-like [Actinia tenebrosa]|uniref:Trace amine-associated receptor 1-like n=1 Tax=Actinia tenebrosa TaxID=6105 RepID=A0A6P8HLZ6_ACTTE|nr:trace amine-associated receptor 1-like [Actinia tenebrosa]
MWSADNTSRTSAGHNSNFFPESTAPLYFWIFSGINGLVTLVCNSLVIFIILKRGRLFRNHSNWLLLSLATADLSVGTIMIPWIFVCFFDSTLPCHAEWNISNIIFDMLLHISVSNLCIVTMDRYLWVVFPMRYQDFMTCKSIIILIISSWLIPASFQTIHALLEFKLSQDQNVNAEKVISAIKVTVFEIAPCMLMLFVYGHIFRICWRHSRNISKINKSLYGKSKKEMTARYNLTSTVKVFCAVIPVFILCWVLAAYREICNVYASCLVPSHLVHISRLLLKGHSMIDPIVYALQKRDIRKEMSKLLTDGNMDEIAGINESNTRDGCVTSKMTKVKLIKRK